MTRFERRCLAHVMETLAVMLDRSNDDNRTQLLNRAELLRLLAHQLIVRDARSDDAEDGPYNT